MHTGYTNLLIPGVRCLMALGRCLLVRKPGRFSHTGSLATAETTVSNQYWHACMPLSFACLICTFPCQTVRLNSLSHFQCTLNLRPALQVPFTHGRIRRRACVTHRLLDSLRLIVQSSTIAELWKLSRDCEPRHVSRHGSNSDHAYKNPTQYDLIHGE